MLRHLSFLKNVLLALVIFQTQPADCVYKQSNQHFQYPNNHNSVVNNNSIKLSTSSTPQALKSLRDQLADRSNNPKTQKLSDYEKHLLEGLTKFEDNSLKWSAEPDKHRCFIDADLPCPRLGTEDEWAGGCGPSFVIFGSPKSGTTSMYEYLSSHPQVSRALSGIFNKEVRYFAEENVHKFSRAWYLRQFPPIQNYSVTVNGDSSHVRMMSGEASPTYMFDMGVPNSIKQTLPKAKLIAVLRDPVERMYSYWRMLVDSDPMFRKEIPFEVRVHEQLNAFHSCYQIDRKKTKAEMMERFLTCFGKPAAHSEVRMYLLVSIYIFQIQNWLAHFPRNQIKVYTSERFFSNPSAVMEEITEFLGLCPINWTEITSKVHNKREFLASSPMPPAVRSKLRAFFLPYNKLLEAELGIKLDEWYAEAEIPSVAWRTTSTLPSALQQRSDKRRRRKKII